jgi:hypothetical protein
MSTRMSFLTIALVATIAIAALSSVITVAPALAVGNNPAGGGPGTGTAIRSCAQANPAPNAVFCTPANPPFP